MPASPSLASRDNRGVDCCVTCLPYSCRSHAFVSRLLVEVEGLGKSRRAAVSGLFYHAT